MAARLVALFIVGLARLVTGLRALWRDGAPTAEQTLYFANHTSHGDFVLLWAALPADLRETTRPVAAADYWLGSRLRRFVGEQVFRAVLILRERGPGDADPLQQMADALEGGSSLVMFPEGTRNVSDEALLPLKSGLYHLARRYPQLRLVPVWIENLRRVLPKGTFVPVPLACTVTFGAPLVVAADAPKAEFLAQARNALLALRAEHDVKEEG